VGLPGGQLYLHTGYDPLPIFFHSVSTTNTEPQKRELDEIDAHKPRGGFSGSARGVCHHSGAAKLEAREPEVEEIDARGPRGSFHSSAHKSRREGCQATPAAAPIAEARDFEVEEIEACEPRGGSRGGPRGRRGVRQVAAAAPIADVRDLEAGIEVRQPRIIKIKPFSTCALCR